MPKQQQQQQQQQRQHCDREQHEVFTATPTEGSVKEVQRFTVTKKFVRRLAKSSQAWSRCCVCERCREFQNFPTEVPELGI